MKMFRSYWMLALVMVLGVTAATATGSRLYSAAQVYAEQHTGPAQTIIIDAGHGGQDGGAVSCTGLMESQLNLQIALRLDCLLNLMGLRTQLTRTADVSLHSDSAQSYSEKKISDLNNRAAMIAQTPQAVVISIHQNHFTQQQYRGAQVFYNASGKELALQTQENLRSALDMTNTRQCKPAEGIFLMEQISCPGILVECGFLSNPAEEQLLRDASYQKKIAAALTVSLGTYLQQLASL